MNIASDRTPRRGVRRSWGIVAVLALLTGCTVTPTEQIVSGAQGSQDQAQGNAVVNIYSARHYNTDNALYDGFKQKTGIQVNIIEGKDSELLERLKSEGDRSPADVFITVDAGRIWRAEQEGLLQSVQSPTLEAAIPANLRHPDGLWYGFSERARIMVYNPAEVQPQELSTYEDLADPKWKGRLCIRSSSNIYNQSLVAALIEKEGAAATETWAQGLVNNFARQPEGGDVDQIRAVAGGSCDVALVNHYYLARLMKSEDPQDKAVTAKVAAFFPTDTHVNISGAGVLAKSPHKDNAVKFLDYLASPEAQKFFAEGNNEYPVVKGIALDPVLKAFGDYQPASVNVSVYGKNNPEAIALMDRVGWK